MARKTGVGTITGTGSDDIITGSNTGDILYGRKGDDILIGSAGPDSLYGGEGADTFVFRPGDALPFTYYDIIMDFEVGQDRIQLNFGELNLPEGPLADGQTFTSVNGDVFEVRAAEVLGDYVLGPDGYEPILDTVITINGGDAIVIRDIPPELLDASFFVGI